MFTFLVYSVIVKLTCETGFKSGLLAHLNVSEIIPKDKSGSSRRVGRQSQLIVIRQSRMLTFTHMYRTYERRVNLKWWSCENIAYNHSDSVIVTCRFISRDDRERPPVTQVDCVMEYIWCDRKGNKKSRKWRRMVQSEDHD